MALTAWARSLSKGVSSSSSMNSGLSLGSLPIRNFSILGASTEYSVAYFGFDDIKVMEEFIAKYDKFVVEVDKGRKYSLQVTKALY